MDQYELVGHFMEEGGRWTKMDSKYYAGEPDAVELYRKVPSKSGKLIFFQTGRHYTEAGQRIGAAWTLDGGIIFVDIDRGIEGYIPKTIVDEYHLSLRKESVMQVYDNQLCPYWAQTYKHEDALRLLREATRAHTFG